MTFKTDKDPNEVLDYLINWADVLSATSDSDTITTSTWSADNGLVVDSDSKTSTTATAWVSAGTLGATAILINTITTALGRTHERSIQVNLEQR